MWGVLWPDSAAVCVCAMVLCVRCVLLVLWAAAAGAVVVVIAHDTAHTCAHPRTRTCMCKQRRRPFQP